MIEDNDIEVDINNSNINIYNTGGATQALVSYPDDLVLSGSHITVGEGNQLMFENTGTGSCKYVSNQGSSNTLAISSDIYDPTYLPTGYQATEENGMRIITLDN